LLSGCTLLLDDFNESLVRCPTLEDPATSFGEFYTQEKGEIDEICIT
jgi:hypothetical protein